MDTRADGLYQTVVVDGRDVHAERMDIVFGSGKLGQSYLYWRDDELFQLPISYLTAPDSWMNSPGYPDGMADFRRPVVGGCLQCHEVADHPLQPQIGSALGENCTRCHMPRSPLLETPLKSQGWWIGPDGSDSVPRPGH
jgi:hypothetical protein